MKPGGSRHIPCLLPGLGKKDEKGDSFAIERGLCARGIAPVAGVDEAGRGPLAGPVVAACVILPQDCAYQLFRDSKILGVRTRENLARVLRENGAVFGLGLAGAGEIDTLNILQATLLAMKRAVQACAQSGKEPACLLVDGTFPVPLAIAQHTLVRGEQRSASIAAASILAKVHRDRLMESLHERYPLYNWQQNKGYPTREHRLAIATHGPCPEHRMRFKGVREYVQARPVGAESAMG